MPPFGNFPRYVSVAERRAKAQRQDEKLRKKGGKLEPVILSGTRIAETFWGKAWCDHLEHFGDYTNRIARGRSYLRNGAVLDLQIEPGKITAVVSGSRAYKVKIEIEALETNSWRKLCDECVGGIDSLVALLQGKLSKTMASAFCRRGDGLFPERTSIRFSCTCPDAATVCKHVAATLLGVGSRLDTKPDLLFRLRNVDHNDLLATLDTGSTTSQGRANHADILQVDDLGALFGLDIAPLEPTEPRLHESANVQSKTRPTAKRRSKPES